MEVIYPNGMVGVAVASGRHFSISFELINPKLISVNDMYIHPVRKCKDGRYRSYVAKSPYLKEVQEYFKEVLPQHISEVDAAMLKNNLDLSSGFYGLGLMLMVGIPEKEFYDHDASNFIKAPEDCISRYLGVDDRCNILVSAAKVKTQKEWSLSVTIYIEIVNKIVRSAQEVKLEQQENERNSNNEV